MIRKLLIAALALISFTGAIAQTEIAKGDVNLIVVLISDAMDTMTRNRSPQRWAGLQKK